MRVLSLRCATTKRLYQQLLLGLAVACAGSTATQASTFSIEVGDEGCGDQWSVSSVPGPIALISDSFDRACAEGAVRGAALAGTGILGALAETNLLDGDHNLYVFSRARAETKFLISGPDGMVSTSINLWLDSSSASDAGGIRLLRVRAFPFGTGVIVIRPPDLQDGEGPGDVVEHGGTMFLPDLNCGPCELTSVELMLPTNTELDFTLELVAIAERRTGTPGFSSVAALDTLTFPSEGPVFNLPDGYTATIFDMNVVDNRFVNPVPEPAALGLLGVGLLGLSLRRRGWGRAGRGTCC